MSVQVKRRRDTAANVAAYTGAQGELIVDVTNNRVTVHDGVTAGGFPAAKLSEVPTLNGLADGVLLKKEAGVLVAAVPGTDYQPASSDVETLTTKSGNYTLSLPADLGNAIASTDTTAVTYTLPPPGSSQIGQWVDVIQGGTGKIQFQTASGVSLLNYSNNAATAGQYAQVRLTAWSISAWLLTGMTGA